MDEVDRVLDGHDFFGFIVGNLATEFLFESHDQFHGIQAVRTKIVNEACIIDDLGFVNTKMLQDS